MKTMTTRELILAMVLIALSSGAWYWAGWASGRAKYEELRAQGCHIVCNPTVKT